MRTTMFLAPLFLVNALTLIGGPVHAAPVKILDCADSETAATWPASEWIALDGTTVTVHPDGASTPPRQCDSSDLPEPPNTTHWTEVAVAGCFASATTVWIDWTPVPEVAQFVTIVIFCDPDEEPYILDIDLTTDSYELLDLQGQPFHFGSWTGYPGNLPPGWTPTGAVREIGFEARPVAIPTLTQLGMIILTALLVIWSMWYLRKTRLS